MDDINKVLPTQIGYIRSDDDTVNFPLDNTSSYLQMLFNSPLFGLMPNRNKHHFKANMCNINKLQEGTLEKHRSAWTMSGVFISSGENNKSMRMSHNINDNSVQLLTRNLQANTNVFKPYNEPYLSPQNNNDVIQQKFDFTNTSEY